MGVHLVLGGTGFLGSRLSEALVARGDCVIAVGRHARRALSGVEQRQLDLFACDPSTLDALLGPVDVVYHLAWSSYAAGAELNPSHDLAENVGFTVRLLEAAARAKCRVVFSSSGGTVYGSSQDTLISEDHPLRPINAYGAAKLSAELYAHVFRASRGLDVRIARLANPFGSGQAPGRLQGAVTRFAALGLAGEPVEIWGSGETVRDYIYVDDAVEALMVIGGAPRESLGSDPVFNVASGAGTSLNQVVRLLEVALQRQVTVLYKTGRSIDVESNILSIDRIRQKTGWRPSLTMEEGLDRLLRELRG